MGGLIMVLLTVLALVSTIFIMACCRVAGDCDRAEEAAKMASRMGSVNRCICCGEIIPEGRWVCPNCMVCVEED